MDATSRTLTSVRGDGLNPHWVERVYVQAHYNPAQTRVDEDAPPDKWQVYASRAYREGSWVLAELPTEEGAKLVRDRATEILHGIPPADVGYAER